MYLLYPADMLRTASTNPLIQWCKIGHVLVRLRWKSSHNLKWHPEEDNVSEAVCNRLLKKASSSLVAKRVRLIEYYWNTWNKYTGGPIAVFMFETTSAAVILTSWLLTPRGKALFITGKIANKRRELLLQHIMITSYDILFLILTWRITNQCHSCQNKDCYLNEKVVIHSWHTICIL